MIVSVKLMHEIKAEIKEVILQNGGCFSDLNSDEFYDEFARDLATVVIELLEREDGNV